MIVTGSDDATVRLYSSYSGEFLASNNRHKLRILDAHFVPNSESKVRKIGWLVVVD